MISAVKGDLTSEDVRLFYIYEIYNDEKLDELPVEFQSYLQDSWIRKWLSSEPNLSEVNLQSYFYYSRDKLSVSGTNIQRMSSQAQELFIKLLNDADTEDTTSTSESV